MKIRTTVFSCALAGSLAFAAMADEPQPDNTRMNERDRRHEQPTPTDQGNSKRETKITAAIRRRITKDKELSFNAKNVKVITIGDRVTLRGPVRDGREREVIGAIAKDTPGVAEVDNQLEVKR